jgi:cytochrome b561
VIISRYSSLAIVLHWLSALMIFAAIGIAWSFDDMPLSPRKLEMISWHKWVGITILGLTALRLFWRTSHRPPALPANMPAWQKWAAHGTHGALYILLVLIPLSGWAMSCAKGYPVVYLGLVELPCLVNKDLELGKSLREAHEWLNITLLVLLAAHLGAALKHHLLDRDNTLSKMLPWIRPRTSNPQ